MGRQISEESAGKRVTRARRIHNTFHWISRQNEITLGTKEQEAILAALDDNRLGAALADLFCGRDGIPCARQKTQLTFIDEQNVDPLDHAIEIFPFR